MGAAVGLIVGLWVGVGVFIQALLVAMVADIVTGVIAAGGEGQISSAVSMRGLAKKATELILVMLTAWLTANLRGYLGEGFPAPEALAGAFFLTELVSILENAKRVGVDLGPLERVLAVARRTPPPSSPPAPSPGAPHG